MSLVTSVSLWGAVLLIAGLIGGLWFVQADDSAWEAVPLAAVLTLTAVVGITWQSRARATRRLQAVLAAYAEQEIGRQRHRTAPLPRGAD
jgi:hypothetical protein